MVMKTIKQPDQWSCVVSCIQMATLQPRNDILKAIGRTDKRNYKSGIDLYRFVPYLYNIGIIIGPGEIALDRPLKEEFIDEIGITVLLNNCIGMFSVESERYKDKLHAVFWDGEYIRDPNPNRGELADMDEYIIHYYAPFIYLNSKLLNNIKKYYHPKKYEQTKDM